MKLTLASWNCAHRNATSAMAMLDRFSPSIVALQECSNAAAAPGDVRWITENQQQQVLMAAKSPFAVRSDRAAHADHFLACEIDGPVKFNVVSVWSATKPKTAYMDVVRHGMSSLSSFITSGPTVLIGDFNISKKLDRQAFDDFVTGLRAKHGLVSAYHAVNGCQPGDEIHATHRHSSSTLHHIDYCFVPEAWLPSVSDVTVGDVAVWPGDHAPIIVAIDAKRLLRSDA